MGRKDVINFEKRRLFAQVLGELLQYQQRPYMFMVEPTIRAYLSNIQGLTEAALYKYSLLCEPRVKGSRKHKAKQGEN